MSNQAMNRISRELKCNKSTCQRKQQNGGLCKHHYRLAMQAQGTPIGLVDSAPVAAHIKTLAGAGISRKRLSELTGLPQTTIWRISSGVRNRVLAGTAERIMSVLVPDMPWSVAHPNALVPVVGTQRRLRALMAAGFTSEMIAARIGVYKRVVTKITGAEHQPLVTARVARATAALFEEWRLTTGPSKITRNRSAAKGWDLPSAWDADEIDNPSAEPHTGKPKDYWYEEYEYMTELGYPVQDICRALNISEAILKDRLFSRQRVYRKVS